MSEVLAVKEIVLLNFLKALHIILLANSLLILVYRIFTIKESNRIIRIQKEHRFKESFRVK